MTEKQIAKLDQEAHFNLRQLQVGEANSVEFVNNLCSSVYRLLYDKKKQRANGNNSSKDSQDSTLVRMKDKINTEKEITQFQEKVF